MDLDETLLDLIGGIYDSALIPDNWNAILPRIGTFVGGSSGGLFAHHSTRRSGNVFYEFGTDPDFRKIYLDKYITMDPMFGTYFVLDVGEVFSTSTIMSHAEFLQSRFYKECIRPQGWIDNIVVYLDRTPKATQVSRCFAMSAKVSPTSRRARGCGSWFRTFAAPC